MSATPLAVYDFDGTMIPGDSIVTYLRFAHRRKVLSLPGLLAAAVNGLRARLGRISTGEAKRRALRFREKMTPEQQAKLDADFAETLLTRLRPAAICQMAQDQAAGRTILLLSASTDNYMEPLARRLGVNGLVCTRIADLPDGNCRGEEKLHRLLEWLKEQGITPDWPASAAYGDSASDAPVLALAGQPVLVDPSARTRQKLQERFPIVHWADQGGD